jgi:hypothetical protein
MSDLYKNPEAEYLKHGPFKGHLRPWKSCDFQQFFPRLNTDQKC